MTTTTQSGSSKTPTPLESGELAAAMHSSISTDQRTKLVRLRPAPEVIIEKSKPRCMKGPDGVAEGVRSKMLAVATGRAPWPLYFFGPAGRGKTMAALCLLDRCWLPYKYYTCKSLRDLLIVAQQGECTTEHPYGVKETEIWQWIKQANIVVLDELGVSEKVTDHHYDTVIGVLDAREFEPLVVISNVPPDGLKRIYDDRIWSRACCGTIIDFSAYPDRRITHSKPGQLEGSLDGRP